MLLLKEASLFLGPQEYDFVFYILIFSCIGFTSHAKGGFGMRGEDESITSIRDTINELP